jgi:uncharacterized membrane protein (DUF373 family)
MSDHKADQVDVREKGSVTISTNHKAGNHNELEDRIATFSRSLLDRGSSFIYTIVGICFFVGALFALGYSFWDFSVGITPIFTQSAQPSSIATAIIQFVSDLLLVLIIMEVLSTVMNYLKAHATSLRPFLFIGIVSATRGILSIGARLSVGDVGNFTDAMIELGVNAAVILTLGITLKLLGKLVED